MENRNLTRLSLAGSGAALGVASCCVLPMVLVLSGLGGSWIAIFGKIAAVSYPVLVLSTMLTALAWVVARRRGAQRRFGVWLTASTLMTAVAWAIVLNETGINDFLITRI